MNLLGNFMRKVSVLALVLPLMCVSNGLQAEPAGSADIATAPVIEIVKAQKINPTAVEVMLSDHQRMTFDFYGENIFRIFQDNSGGILRDPKASPEAQILVDSPKKALSYLQVKDAEGFVTISTAAVQIRLDKKTTLFSVKDLRTGKTVIEETAPVVFDPKRVTMTLKADQNEYFYGGGVQNGRFSHKGEAIWIENQNRWTDGGVASPNPYYWSTKGYGVMWYTFKKGKYDFGAADPETLTMYHETDYLDVFFMVDEGMVPLLNDFYQLTGHPVLLPKFGFYEGHLNAYNRDYWLEDDGDKSILFEDGIRYREIRKDESGIKESLNGEKNNYQFSARAVVDRYKNHDMPLGWVLPNDGYGAGYGQTGTLDGNILNLKEFGDYARANGVEIGLWTQSDLHPKQGVSALLQRDIVKEVRDAGVRVLKTDVAWVGAGYSFGLNGVADVGQIMPYYGNDARPFIISLDGWAGTQRYATVWSGDQTGGKWEYIRFHIPTYIGSGLSGQPNITSDMDGIFGGKNPTVNIRDFQWKTFTPMQLNMDGWGANEKYPHALGEPAASINRWYLKLKSELLPYSYSVAEESVDGLPIIRPMFVEETSDYTLGKTTQYQYMYGPSFLVAPIYQDTQADEEGNDVRNGIFLPEGRWIDWFTGEVYEGGRILNNFDAPIWKLPVFVKAGAIIPLVNPNNNVSQIDPANRIYEIYPYGHSSFKEYDDDGRTQAYLLGEGAETVITSDVDAKGRVIIKVGAAEGEFEGMVKEKSTEFRIPATAAPKKVSARIGGAKVKLAEATDLKSFSNGSNVFYYEENPELNRFATPGSEFASRKIAGCPRILVKLAKADITATEVELVVDGYEFAPADRCKVTSGALKAPVARMTAEHVTPYTLTPSWEKVANADFYEIEFNGMLYSTVKEQELLFEDLVPETSYAFRLRAVNKDGCSEWTEIKARTADNPLEFAIQGITGECTALSQGRSGISRMFNFEENDLWHSKYGRKAVPFDIVMDLNTINHLDRFQYLPREDGGNGTILKGEVFHSMDKESWTSAGSFEWNRSGEVKEFSFKGNPEARYIRISVSSAAGDFGSGREFYVFKVAGTESKLPGDINHDMLLDMNDFTSYMNYTGLRQGDGDFEGYVSNGDINVNGLIDAYDISVLSTRIRGGVEARKDEQVEGRIVLAADKKKVLAGETVTITVKGENLKDVNALSFAMPYSQKEYEFLGIEPLAMKQMENLTNDRLHTNGQKALYPTFVNIGDKDTLSGNEDLFVLKFKAKANITFKLEAIDGFLVDKKLHTLRF